MSDWIGGKNPVYEVLRANRRQCFQLLVAREVKENDRLLNIVELCKSKKIHIKHTTRNHLNSIVPRNQGVILKTSRYPYCSFGDILDSIDKQTSIPIVLLLDTLQDPQNLATLLRTAEIVGVNGVLLPYRRTATITNAVVNASSGACEHMLITQTNLAQAIKTLKDAGLWIIGLENSSEALNPNQAHLDVPLGLVVGNEADGIRSLVRSSCDLLLRLPMQGRIESLNAAVAGSVALYLSWQARNYSETTSD